MQVPCSGGCLSSLFGQMLVSSQKSWPTINRLQPRLSLASLAMAVPRTFRMGEKEPTIDGLPMGEGRGKCTDLKHACATNGFII